MSLPLELYHLIISHTISSITPSYTSNKNKILLNLSSLNQSIHKIVQRELITGDINIPTSAVAIGFIRAVKRFGNVVQIRSISFGSEFAEEFSIDPLIIRELLEKSQIDRSVLKTIFLSSINHFDLGSLAFLPNLQTLHLHYVNLSALPSNQTVTFFALPSLQRLSLSDPKAKDVLRILNMGAEGLPALTHFALAQFEGYPMQLNTDLCKAFKGLAGQLEEISLGDVSPATEEMDLSPLFESPKLISFTFEAVDNLEACLEGFISPLSSLRVSCHSKSSFTLEQDLETIFAILSNPSLTSINSLKRLALPQESLSFSHPTKAKIQKLCDERAIELVWQNFSVEDEFDEFDEDGRYASERWEEYIQPW